MNIPNLLLARGVVGPSAMCLARAVRGLQAITAVYYSVTAVGCI